MRCIQVVLVAAVMSAQAGIAFALPNDRAPQPGASALAPSRPPPPPPPENDPLLEPIAPAARIVATWDDAISALRARSTDLRIALDEIERTEGAWRESLAASLPTLIGTGSVTLNALRGYPCSVAGNCSTVQAPDLVVYGAGVTLTQPLLAPRAWHAARTSKLGIEVAQLSVEEQKRLLTIALANAVVAVVASERIGEINRAGLRAALDRHALAKRRVALGGGTALDSVRAEQDVSLVRAAVVSGNEAIRKAREALGFALGTTEAWGVPPGIDVNGVEASAHASCEAAGAIEERADIAAARRASDIAKRNVDNAKLGLSPTLDLVSTLGVITSFGDRPARFASGLHEVWTIAGMLTVPFYDGGTRYGALRETRALADQSAQRLEATRRLASIQITQARRSVEVAEQSRQVAENARDLARETDRLARIAFQVGTGTSLDLVEAGRRLREAEVQLALQEFGVVQAKISALLSLSRCRW